MFLSARPFAGGIHPKGFKELTEDKYIDRLDSPDHLYLNLQQRNGAKLVSLVEVGETVFKGQLLAKGSSDMAVPLHSPVNGKLEAIKEVTSPHPAGLKTSCMVLSNNGDPRWGEDHRPCDYRQLTPEQIIQKVLDAGIVGLGGAAFPTGVKLRLARQAKVHTLLINGGECEPYLTCDDRLMREQAAEIVSGVQMMLKALGAQQAIIAVEDNKGEAIAMMADAIAELPQISLKSVPSLYPMGSERHLIKAVTGEMVPPGQLSTKLGILVNNVATARAVFHAVRFSRPLIERVITVSGAAVEEPGNLVVPIGTLVSQLIAQCGGLKVDAARLVAGGPMMGQALPSPFVPTDKSIGGVLALTESELRQEQSHACVRCGSCVEACPMGLMPFQMAAYSRVSDWPQAQHFGLDNCLLCGACSYVCPSKIPLVQYFQHARGNLNAQRSMRQKSAHARELTQARQLRLAKEAEAKKAAKAAKASKRKRPARRRAASGGEE